jgi:hypothetical protein
MQRRVVVLACLWALGCGGGAPAEPVATEPTSGSEAVVAPQVETEPVEEEPVAEPPPRGPGRLRLSNIVGNQEVGGTVRILDARGSVVAEGPSGQTFNVDAGTYRIAGSITDAAVILDRPTREADDEVTVTPGQETVGRVVHPVARVRLRVTRRGRPVTNWRAEVRRQSGGDPIELRPSETHTPISPGRYDAVVQVGGERFELSGVVFQGGSTADVPVNIE